MCTLKMVDPVLCWQYIKIIIPHACGCKKHAALFPDSKYDAAIASKKYKSLNVLKS